MDLEATSQRAYEHFGTKHTHPERERGHSFYHGQRVARLAVTLRKAIVEGTYSIRRPFRFHKHTILDVR